MNLFFSSFYKSYLYFIHLFSLFLIIFSLSQDWFSGLFKLNSRLVHIIFGPTNWFGSILQISSGLFCKYVNFVSHI